MANAFFRLRKVTAKTSQIIYVGIRYGLDQLIVPTGIKVLPKHWDFDKSRIKRVSLPEVSLPHNLLARLGNTDVYSFVNDYLHDLSVFVNDKSFMEKDLLKQEIEVYLNGKNEIEQLGFDLNLFVSNLIAESRQKNAPLSKETLIKNIDTFLHPPIKGIRLFDYIETFISDCITGRRLINGANVNDRSVKRYLTTQNLLKEFSDQYKRPVEFKTIDIDFYKDFSFYMAKHKDYAPATMGKHVTTLKTFLREATENGLNDNLKYQSRAFAVTSSESDSIALSVEELNELYQLDLFDNLRLDKVRDLFIVGANTGLRFSDFTDIKPDNIKKVANGYIIDLIQFKTKNQVVIPLNDITLAIFRKYNNQLPEAISNQKFNDYIKQVAQMVTTLHEPITRAITKGGKQLEVTSPKWELISSHTARRSYATNAYERGTPAISLMQITGHRTEKAFLSYIKTSKKKHAEIVRGHH